MSGKSLCLIPARGGSKRLERKNVRLLAGKPLIAHTIEAAIASKFERVIVSTEDSEIADVSMDYGAEVPFSRPQNLASDTAQVVDVTDHALEYFDEHGVNFEHLAVLLPTTPLRTSRDLDEAFSKYLGHAEAEFLMCVTDYRYSPFEALHPQNDLLEQFWEERAYYETRSQERPELVVDNGAAYIMNIDSYKRERTFYGNNLIGYYIPPERSVDIDEKFDLELAEFLLQR